MNKLKKIAVIGGGVMGTVLARALSEDKAAAQIVVVERNPDRYGVLRKLGKSVLPTANYPDAADADIVFLAVKPQDFGSVDMAVRSSVLVCSIMAGVNVTKIRRQLKAKKIIRMMPNTPAMAGVGFTAWTASKEVAPKERKWVKQFLGYLGADLYVQSENDIDKATAVTGSGPAYIFEAMANFEKAAVGLGFPQKEARRMVGQVLRGANALIGEDSDFEELAKQVTSKGGTTAAALEVFRSKKMGQAWVAALRAAYKRAKELSK